MVLIPHPRHRRPNDRSHSLSRQHLPRRLLQARIDTLSLLNPKVHLHLPLARESARA